MKEHVALVFSSFLAELPHHTTPRHAAPRHATPCHATPQVQSRNSDGWAACVSSKAKREALSYFRIESGASLVVSCPSFRSMRQIN